METFERPMDDLECTARRESSVVMELYHCVNGTGVLLESCRRGQSTSTRRVSINCSVTIHTESENVSETFYCIERMLFDTTNQLSAHFSVVVASLGKPLIGANEIYSSPCIPMASLKFLLIALLIVNTIMQDSIKGLIIIL